MAARRVFISFDLDHDNDLKQRLVEDASTGSTPAFDPYDWSIREAADDWRDKLRKRISNVEALVVACGGYTDRSANVAAELELARELQCPFYLLDGRPPTTRRPAGTDADDRLLAWTRQNLMSIGGATLPPPITVALDDLRPETKSRLRLRRR